MDPRLADIVERMFRNTYDEGEYKQAVMMSQICSECKLLSLYLIRIAANDSN